MSGIVNLLPMKRSERVGYAKIGLNHLPRLYTGRSYYDHLLCKVQCEGSTLTLQMLVDNDPVGSGSPALGLKYVHPYFDLYVYYGMIKISYILLNIGDQLISVVIIFVVAVVYENFSITKISRTTVYAVIT